jgi:hypothetical protein
MADFESLGRPELLACCPDNVRKEALVRSLEALRPSYALAVHPKAVVASSARLGAGVIINAGP